MHVHTFCIFAAVTHCRPYLSGFDKRTHKHAKNCTQNCFYRDYLSTVKYKQQFSNNYETVEDYIFNQFLNYLAPCSAYSLEPHHLQS